MQAAMSSNYWVMGMPSHKRSGLACEPLAVETEALQVKDQLLFALAGGDVHRALAALRVWAIHLRPSQRG